MSTETVVFKFGGTSVGNIERIKASAQRVAGTFNRGGRLVVVVSAMAGQTDGLLNMGRSVNKSISIEALREMDALAATGEQASAALFALALQDLGVRAESFTAHQVTIATDGRFQRGRIRNIDSKPLLDRLDRGTVCVVAGFQGTDDAGNVVTLGRGGSDTSAVALAVALNATRCEIYKDVEGVYTADPRLVPAAKKLDCISFDEMLELTSTGAKVLHMRSVEMAMKQRLELCVRSSFSEAVGTTIKHIKESMEQPVVSALSHDLRQAKVSITGLPGTPDGLTMALEPLAKEDISVDFITQNVGADGRMSVAFTIDEKLVEHALASVRLHLEKLGHPECSVSVDPNLAKVSAVGLGMRSHAGVAYRFFSALTRQGLPIHMALSTEIRVSCLITADQCQRALQVLHDEFFPAS